MFLSMNFASERTAKNKPAALPGELRQQQNRGGRGATNDTRTALRCAAILPEHEL